MNHNEKEKCIASLSTRVRPSTKKLLEAIPLLTGTPQQQFVDEAILAAIQHLPEDIQNRLHLLTDLVPKNTSN